MTRLNEAQGKLTQAITMMVTEWQAENPGCLMSAADITGWVADHLEISTQGVRARLTDAVREGLLTEVFVRRDWLTILPGGEDLPPLYPQLDEEEQVYRLVREVPESRGSNGLTFLLPPSAYEALLLLLRRTHGTAD